MITLKHSNIHPSGSGSGLASKTPIRREPKMSSFSFFPFHPVSKTELDTPLRHITGKSQRLRHVASRRHRERDWTGEEVHSSRHPPTAHAFQSGRCDLKCELPHRNPAAPYQRTSSCHWETWGREWNVFQPFSYSFFFNKKNRLGFIKNIMCSTVWSGQSDLHWLNPIYLWDQKKKKKKKSSFDTGP